MLRFSTIAAVAVALLTAACDPNQRGLVAQDKSAVEQYVASEFSDAPIMVKVAKCESGLQQFYPDGSLVRGIRHPPDVGVCQINEAVHSTEARALGFDLHTLAGNVKYCRHLFDEEGTQPWESSRKCWGIYQTASK